MIFHTDPPQPAHFIGPNRHSPRRSIDLSLLSAFRPLYEPAVCAVILRRSDFLQHSQEEDISTAQVRSGPPVKIRKFFGHRVEEEKGLTYRHMR